jgi:hypothetical protein
VKYWSQMTEAERQLAIANKNIIMSNADENDMLFHNDRGSWNVSRALRDCRAGKHKRFILDVAKAYHSNKAVEVDKAKVRRFIKTPEVFGEPLLGVVEGGPVWLIDGHHRLRAMYKLDIKEFVCWIIAEADAAPYQVWYNGERKPPWRPY